MEFGASLDVWNISPSTISAGYFGSLSFAFSVLFDYYNTHGHFLKVQVKKK
jgi:hypothetical protein